MRSSCAVSYSVFFLVLWCSSGSELEVPVERALTTDDECISDGQNSCAVNALQLKGKMEAAADVSETLDKDTEEDDGSEARELGEENEDHEVDAQVALGDSTSKWPSCYKYGCFARYSRYSICQCNPNCHRQHNCCPDYYKKCWHKRTKHRWHQHSEAHPVAPARGGSASGKCAAVPACARLRIGGPNGDCCPTKTGMYLGCCPDAMVPHPTAPPPTVVNGRRIMTVYHQTSPAICRKIMAGGFRIGHGGWCGNAIYFALSPMATKTKAITPHSGTGCIIEATVDVGHTKKFPCCRYCGGKQDEHVYWTEGSLQAQGYNSIEINPGDGPEIIVYNKKQILNMRIIPWNEKWRPHLLHYKE